MINIRWPDSHHGETVIHSGPMLCPVPHGRDLCMRLHRPSRERLYAFVTMCRPAAGPGLSSVYLLEVPVTQGLMQSENV